MLTVKHTGGSVMVWDFILFLDVEVFSLSVLLFFALIITVKPFVCLSVFKGLYK